MSNLQEVPTDELLSFHDYPVVHQNSTTTNLEQAQINVTINDDDFEKSNVDIDDPLERDTIGAQPKVVSLWSLEYFQRFFDVNTKDVTDRIIASITPKVNCTVRKHMTEKPDLYGPFWISTTLVFAIAVSGNIADYLQHATKEHNHWRYDFKLVSYAATAIWTYVLLIPIFLWGILSFTMSENAFGENKSVKSPSLLELVCIYGYSLFIYIPISVLWTIQISNLQWFLAIVSALLSGSVLLMTLMPALRGSKYKLFLVISIVSCHLMFVAGFLLYFFHATNISESSIAEHNTNAITTMKNITSKGN